MIEENLTSCSPSELNNERARRTTHLSATHSLNTISYQTRPVIGRSDGVEKLPFGIGQKTVYQAASSNASPPQISERRMGEKQRHHNLSMSIEATDAISARNEPPGFMPALTLPAKTGRIAGGTQTKGLKSTKAVGNSPKMFSPSK